MIHIKHINILKSNESKLGIYFPTSTEICASYSIYNMLSWYIKLTYLLQSLPELIQTDFHQNPDPVVLYLHLKTSQNSP